MRCGDFSPDTCCLTLQLKVPAITLRRKSARRSICSFNSLMCRNFRQPRDNKKGQAMKPLLDHKGGMKYNIQKVIPLYCTRHRWTNGSPSDFVGSGMTIAGGCTTVHR